MLWSNHIRSVLGTGRGLAIQAPKRAMDRGWLLSPDIVFHLVSLGLQYSLTLPIFYIVGRFCYCHLSFQTSKNTERSQISALALAMHCPNNGAGFHFFSKMNQKAGVLGRYLNSTRQYEMSSLYSVLIYLLTWAVHLLHSAIGKRGFLSWRALVCLTLVSSTGCMFHQSLYPSAGP